MSSGERRGGSERVANLSQFLLSLAKKEERKSFYKPAKRGKENAMLKTREELGGRREKGCRSKNTTD